MESEKNKKVKLLCELAKGYEGLKEWCRDFDKNEEKSPKLKLQPEYVKKADGSEFDVEDCEKFLKGDYVFCESDDEQKDKDQSQFGQLQLATFSADMARSDLDVPSRDKVHSRKPFAFEPFSGHELCGGFFLSIILIIALVASVVGFVTSTVTKVTETAKMETMVVSANDELDSIYSLFDSTAYTEWTLLWDGQNTTDDLKDAWASVESEWESLGYVLTAETLQEIFEDSALSGTIRLTSVAYNIVDYFIEVKIGNDDDIMTRTAGGDFYLTNSWQYENSTMLGAIAVQAFSILGFILSIVLLIVVSNKSKNSAVKFLFELVTVPVRLLVYLFLLLVYQFKNKKLDRIDNQNADRKYDRDMQNYKSQRDGEIREYEKNYKNELDTYYIKYADYVRAKDEYLYKKDLELIKIFNSIKAVQVKYDSTCADTLPSYYVAELMIDCFNSEANPKMETYGYYVAECENELNAVIDILKKGRANTLENAINTYYIDCENERKQEQEWERERQEVMAKERAMRLLQEDADSSDAAYKKLGNTMIDTQISQLRVELKSYPVISNDTSIRRRKKVLMNEIRELERQKMR